MGRAFRPAVSAGRLGNSGIEAESLVRFVARGSLAIRFRYHGRGCTMFAENSATAAPSAAGCRTRKVRTLPVVLVVRSTTKAQPSNARYRMARTLLDHYLMKPRPLAVRPEELRAIRRASSGRSSWPRPSESEIGVASAERSGGASVC